MESNELFAIAIAVLAAGAIFFVAPRWITRKAGTRRRNDAPDDASQND